MKSIAIAFAGLALATATSAVAADDPSQTFAGEVFSSRGACLVALNQERNANRKSNNIGQYDWDTYIRYYQANFTCIEIDKGSWIIASKR